MKNSLKNKKSIIAARVMLVLLLLIGAVSFAGCVNNPKYEFLPTYFHQTHLLPSIAFSTSNIFDIEEVNINLSYGVLGLDIFGNVKSNPKEQMPNAYLYDKFVLSICLRYAKDTIIHIGRDDNCIEVSRVYEEDLFSKEYGYINTPFFINGGTVYMHTESIHIPSCLFIDDYGNITIKLMVFGGGDDIDINTLVMDNRFLVGEDFITIEYRKIDENTIELLNFIK